MDNKYGMAMHVFETTEVTRRASADVARGRRRAALSARHRANAGRHTQVDAGKNDGHAAVLRTWLNGMSAAEKAYRPRRRRMA